MSDIYGKMGNAFFKLIDPRQPLTRSTRQDLEDKDLMQMYEDIKDAIDDHEYPEGSYFHICWSPRFQIYLLQGFVPDIVNTVMDILPDNVIPLYTTDIAVLPKLIATEEKDND